MRDALDARSASAAARTFKALSDESRLRLLSIVASHPEGEACICDLTGPVGLSQPTVSHHMRVLADAGLIVREQRGKWAYFSLAATAQQQLGSTIAAIIGAAPLARTTS